MVHKSSKLKLLEPTTAGKQQPSEKVDPEERAKRRRLVRRQHVLTIASAWVVTVPATAVLAGALFWGLRALF